MLLNYKNISLIKILNIYLNIIEPIKLWKFAYKFYLINKEIIFWVVLLFLKQLRVYSSEESAFHSFVSCFVHSGE